METEEVKLEEHLGNMFQCAPETRENIYPEDIDEMLAFNPKPPNTPDVIHRGTDNNDTHMTDVTTEEIKTLPQPGKNKSHVGSKKQVTWAKQEEVGASDFSQEVVKKPKKM